MINERIVLKSVAHNEYSDCFVNVHAQMVICVDDRNAIAQTTIKESEAKRLRDFLNYHYYEPTLLDKIKARLYNGWLITLATFIAAVGGVVSLFDGAGFNFLLG